MIGFISVRTKSTRLPDKCLLSFGESTVLNHIIRRAVFYGIEPIVCTSTLKEDDVIVQIASKENVRCYRGSLNNKLQRWLGCAIHYDIDSFHTIDADDPFFDGDEMKSSMKILRDKDFDMIAPTKSSSAGGASVGYSLTTDVVKKACYGLDEDSDTEMMWYFLEKVSKLKTMLLPEKRKNIAKMRLTLDYEEDYWLLNSVRRILGNLASRDEVNRLFLLNPDLHKINWFRNKQWRQAQINKKI